MKGMFGLFTRKGEATSPNEEQKPDRFGTLGLAGLELDDGDRKVLDRCIHREGTLDETAGKAA